MAKPPPSKTKTRQGLGIQDAPLREEAPLGNLGSSEIARVRDSFRRDDPPPESARTPSRIRDTLRREEEPDEPTSPSAPPSTSARSWQPEASTGTRTKGTPRPPVTVDQVGPAAVKMAQSRRESAPRLVASREVIANAPIDTRAAFVLSLVDGANSVDALIDMSGMPEAEVKTILARLNRLGLIST